ncbi:ubiquitin carboxyl-terminal hydrolase 17-like protein 6 [Daphnia carinata]|uniref:ubiquitin carboxyl-terminal hydrolase 17-like protein 6 n=1 Tax=Daphnia carinata TaxID=120202 RepID=UPI0025800204|nr:ubiquitin carboxyl-terminal hydrolase 17-like protein 6 [Daphnia carinata]
MPGYVSSFQKNPKERSEILFDNLKRNISQASLSKGDKHLPHQERNSVSFWLPNPRLYNLGSTSSHDDSREDTEQFQKKLGMANTCIEPFPDVQPLAKPANLNLKEACPTQAVEPVVALFEDPIDLEANKPSCWTYSAQKTHTSRKKSKPLIENELTNVKNSRKRASPTSTQKQQQENKKALDLAMESSTQSFPVKSFYGGNNRVNQTARSPTFVENKQVSNIPKLVNLDELHDEPNLAISQPGPSVITRSRSLSSQSFLPYEIGLRNFGNTCYVNAILQVLFALPGFTDDLVSAFQQVENLPCFCVLFAKIVDARKTGLSHAVNVNTQNFVENLWTLHPSYSVREQQDANEFLVRLIEQMKWALPPGPANPVESHFQCEMIEVYHCAKCGKKKKNVQKNTSICLPLSESSCNLEQCLEAYMAEEERDLACSNCKATSMKISSKFRTLPSKLIMSVNRFSKDAKLAKHVVPPRVLDVRRFMENTEDVLPSQYALTAQIVHIGETKNFGHYVSHVYCEDGEWRCYNDMSILTVSLADDIQSVDGDPAYVYFYIHQSPDE